MSIRGLSVAVLFPVSLMLVFGGASYLPAEPTLAPWAIAIGGILFVITGLIVLSKFKDLPHAPYSADMVRPEDFE